MPNLFDHLDEICDDWLSIDETWPGEHTPRYQNEGTLQQLSQQGFDVKLADSLALRLLRQMHDNWNGEPTLSTQNWRFDKRLNLAENANSPEVILERTICSVADDNWANQIPTASGVGCSGPRGIDLARRIGTRFELIELKVGSNNPLAAAFQIFRYGMVYTFSQQHYSELGYDALQPPILNSDGVDLVVLAPRQFYNDAYLPIFETVEQLLNEELNFLSNTVSVPCPETFRFESFPDEFAWDWQNHEEETVRRDVLWNLHFRQRLFGG